MKTGSGQALPTIKNYVNGEWVESKSARTLDIINPVTTEVLARVPVSTREEVEEAVQHAVGAFKEWRETPPLTRARYMFTLKNLMEDRFEEVSRILVQEHGKTIDESRGEVRRAIECVEHAAGIPTLMMGYNAEMIAPGMDEECILQPLGLFCCLPPSNFPAMIPFWFLPYAVACGNTYIVKPSSEVPLSMNKMFELIHEADFPPGVINLVNGTREVADVLLESKDIKGVSFVGSTSVARYVYAKAASTGKRAQCQGGAKNFLVVMPDAPLDRIMPAIMNSSVHRSLCFSPAKKHTGRPNGPISGATCRPSVCLRAAMACTPARNRPGCRFTAPYEPS